METPKHQLDTRVCTSPRGHLRTVFHGIRGGPPDPNRADGLAPGISRHGPGSACPAYGSEAGLKPMADGTRRMLPLGSPKGEGRHDQGPKKAPEESQVVRLIHPKAEPVPMPSDRGAGEIVRRVGFQSAWTARHRWPSSDRQTRLAGCV